MAERKQMEQFFITAGVSNEVRHIHHLRDPHIISIYGPFNNKVIQEDTLSIITNAFVHDPSHPLLVTSNNRIDLIFIPIIDSACDDWNQCLKKNKVEVINDLKFACNHLDSSLIFFS